MAPSSPSIVDPPIQRYTATLRAYVVIEQDLELLKRSDTTKLEDATAPILTAAGGAALGFARYLPNDIQIMVATVGGCILAAAILFLGSQYKKEAWNK